MANTVKMSGNPAASYYFTIRRATDYHVWNGSLFTAWSDGSIASYAQTFTHIGGGLFTRTFPAAITTGTYILTYFWRRGGTPNFTNDLVLFHRTKDWDGSSFITPGQATPAQIADAVWDESASAHNTAGSTGAKLNSAAAAGDPLASAVPGSYPAGTAGHALGITLPYILQGVNRINPSRVVTSSAVLESGLTIVTVRGDDYTADSPRGPLAWIPANDDDWPDLTDATGVFTSRLASTDAVELIKPIQIENPAGPGKRIFVELTAEETEDLTPSLTPKDHKFDIQITLANEKIWTPIRGGDNLTRSGGHTVIEDQTRPDPS